MSTAASAAPAQEPLSAEDEMGQHLRELQEARKGTPAAEAAPVETAAAPVAEAAADPATPAPPAADAQAPAATPAEKSPEQLLADKQAELHRITSEIGRVSALNRANQEKAQEIAQLRQQLADARKPPETPSEARTRLEQLAEQVKDFPELLSVVKTVGDALKEVETKAQTVAEKAAQQAVAPMEPLRRQHLDQQEKDQEAATAADLQAFNATYPKDVVVDVIQSDDFKQWLPRQPMAIQFSFRKGETPGEAMAVMDAYDAHLRRSGKPSIARTPETQQSAPAAEPQKSTNRLAQAAGIPSRATGAGKGALPPQDDFDGSLEFFRKQRLQQQAQRA